MGKIRRAGYVFLTWVGDQSPYHVHVYRGGKLLLKWDLENDMPMKGKATARIVKIVDELRNEGKL